MLKGFDCTECRLQYDAANRSDAVPCDEGGLEACPFIKRECGSPGDDSEKGCGLAEENVAAVEFFPKWDLLGEAAFNLLEIDVGDSYDTDALVTKLMLIKAYAPSIAAAIQDAQQEAKSEKKPAKRQRGPERT